MRHELWKIKLSEVFMKIIKVCFVIAALTAFVGSRIDQIEVSAASQKIESVYTDLTTEKCKTIEQTDDEGGSYRGECAGVGGYKLEVLEGDLRQSINVVAPNRKKFELDIWTTVSSGFSSFGGKAEWRVTRSGKKITPKAFIVRYNASENPEKPEQTTSYLVVVKISKTAACVTDVVNPTVKNQNVKARQLADASANKPCKSSE
jgi:hypothetical protein